MILFSRLGPVDFKNFYIRGRFKGLLSFSKDVILYESSSRLKDRTSTTQNILNSTNSSLLPQEMNSLLILNGIQEEIVDPRWLLKLIIYEYTRKIENIPIEKKFSLQLKNLQLSDIDNSLRKNIFSSRMDLNPTKLYANLGPKYNYIYSNYRYLLPTKELREALDLIFFLVNPGWSESNFLDFLKNFGTYLLSLVINRGYPTYLLYFIELHILSGYDTAYHRNFSILNDTLPFSTSYSSINPIYESYIKEEIDRAVSDIHIHQYRNLNFEDFVRYRDNWEIMGSATLGQPMKISTPGFNKPSRIASKFTNLLYYDDDTLIRKLLESAPHIARPFLKSDEPAKARVVIGYDTRSYIRCTYLEKFIDKFNGSSTWTTVGLNPQELSVQQDRIKKYLGHSYHVVCSDQSAFDQHQSKYLFMYAFSKLTSAIAALNPQVKPIVELEIQGLHRAELVYPDGQKRQWKSGLLSGHKFTALIGSILNRAESRTVFRLMRLTPVFDLYQGDDAIAIFKTPVDSTIFAKTYKVLGFDVNPNKTWNNTYRTEYLHQIYLKDRVISLPTRAALNLIFNDPKSIKLGPDQLLNSNLDSLMMCMRRGLDCEKLCLGYLRRELRDKSTQYNSGTRSSNLRLIRDTYNYLHTPKIFGGVGCLPYVDSTYYTTLSVSKSYADGRPKISTIISPFHYVVNEDRQFTQRWILEKIHDHLPAPGIITKIALNRVDMFAKFRNILYRPPRVYFSFNPKIKDNSQRWIWHCQSLLNEACELGGNYCAQYARARKSLDSTFCLYNSWSKQISSTLHSLEWKEHFNRTMDNVTIGRVSLNRGKAFLNYIRISLWNSICKKPVSSERDIFNV